MSAFEGSALNSGSSSAFYTSCDGTRGEARSKFEGQSKA